MTARIAFRFALLAAAVMLAVTPLFGLTVPSCAPLPMPPLMAFELARSVADLQRIFGMAGDICRAPLVAQLNQANIVDTIVYIPAYTAFYALTLYALGRRDRAIGYAGVAVALACAIADWTENTSLFQLSAAPDTPSVWLSVLMVGANIKWVGLAVATTLGGVMVWRRGGLGWLAFFPCALPLGVSIWALVAPDAAGRWLAPGMVVASVVFLMIAGVGAFGKVAATQANS
ncbi:MAG: hypothetical protein GC155_09275 [Alphaproteobacteria bacterium]|nr:hypothetical protein [Alphaproteobacteria bacterium]